MNQWPPLNVKLQAGTIPGWYVIILQAPSMVLEECEHSVNVGLNEMSALKCFHIRYLSGGKVEQFRERILMKHKMVD